MPQVTDRVNQMLSSIRSKCLRSGKSIQSIATVSCAAWVLITCLPAANAVTTTTTTISSTTTLLTTSTIWVNSPAATGVPNSINVDVQRTEDASDDPTIDIAPTGQDYVNVSSLVTLVYTSQVQFGGSCSATTYSTRSASVVPSTFSGNGSNATVLTRHTSSAHQPTHASTASSGASRTSAYAVHGKVAAVLVLIACYLLLPTRGPQQCFDANGILDRQHQEGKGMDGRETILHNYNIADNAAKDGEIALPYTVVMDGSSTSMDQKASQSSSIMRVAKLLPRVGPAGRMDVNSSGDNFVIPVTSISVPIWSCGSPEDIGSKGRDLQNLHLNVTGAKSVLAIVVILLYVAPLVASQAINSTVRTPAAEPSLAAPTVPYQESAVDQQAVFSSSSVTITNTATETNYRVITVCGEEQVPESTSSSYPAGAGNATHFNTTTWASVQVSPVPATNVSWIPPSTMGLRLPQSMAICNDMWMPLFALVSTIIILPAAMF